MGGRDRLAWHMLVKTLMVLQHEVGSHAPVHILPLQTRSVFHRDVSTQDCSGPAGSSRSGLPGGKWTLPTQE